MKNIKVTYQKKEKQKSNTIGNKKIVKLTDKKAKEHFFENKPIRERIKDFDNDYFNKKVVFTQSQPTSTSTSESNGNKKISDSDVNDKQIKQCVIKSLKTKESEYEMTDFIKKQYKCLERINELNKNWKDYISLNPNQNEYVVYEKFMYDLDDDYELESDDDKKKLNSVLSKTYLQYNNKQIHNRSREFILYCREKMREIEHKDVYLFLLEEMELKRNSYKHQDIKKTNASKGDYYNIEKMISLNEIISLLYDTNMKCYYCLKPITIYYENIREKNQWTLDRIDNNKGHWSGNCVIACLSCNISRGRMDDQRFWMTKRKVIVKKT